MSDIVIKDQNTPQDKITTVTLNQMMTSYGRANNLA